MREATRLNPSAPRVGPFSQIDMLHRTKYSRFRNDSLTSLEDCPPNTAALTATTKAAPCPASSVTSLCGSPVSGYPPHRDTLGSPEEGTSTLCTFIPRMANIKISSPGTLLGLKSLALASREGPRGKLSPDCGTAKPQHHLSGYLPPSSHLRQGFGDGKLAVRTEVFRSSPLKPTAGTECPTLDVLESGMTYHIKYMGCLEVVQSMRMLDFETRTQVTREAISRLCEYVPGAKTATKRKKPASKGLSTILGKSNLQFSGMNIKLNISTDSLSLTTLDSQQTIAHHHMQAISFASGGDPDTTDYVAYVAKDPVNQRAVHILECPEGLAQEVIHTIGQAFELRFRQFLKNPSSLIATKQRATEAGGGGSRGQESAEVHEYYNEIPGKEPPPGGLLDMRVGPKAPQQPPSGSQAEEDDLRRPGCPEHLNVYENCSLTHMQLPSADLEKGVPVLLPDSKEAAYSTLGEEGGPVPGGPAQALEPLQLEVWYHGSLSRREAESLLKHSGDFLVRESTSSPGQYVLSGLEGGAAKHLLLVDPQGMVRTKDHIFDSVGHLIRYHMDNQRPIVSCGSELCLKQPVIH
ncbi:SHC-transforming protein 1-like isoform X1 [Conger conger]|uniref:SHC-transforming protein 1-like isoform X1 n=1 Tax=Conger conger TaxID=82655 RepID=UPI002A5AF29B|nr:SHC-transforming protein 1-like isoform X1 [Conger conger]XP_061101290.1 SHC-transforming protein 1-like isoform X1 [Conger conger]XP_061101291.1 SHC-transforming protein 1-like isoform X1 [Conger conger]XP_061101292.1 SHC-transforming protein 1-like isoform X1 [Conger conger]